MNDHHERRSHQRGAGDDAPHVPAHMVILNFANHAQADIISRRAMKKTMEPPQHYEIIAATIFYRELMHQNRLKHIYSHNEQITNSIISTIYS